MTVLSEVNLAVCDSLFSLFSQSFVLYLASDIQKIAPAFAELTLRPKSSALTTPERNVFFSLSRERHWIFSFLQLPSAKSHLGTERR